MDVLVVEDDPLVRETVACGLADAGLHIGTAAMAEHAIEVAEAVGPPIVLVTDIDLGCGIDGVGLASEFAQRWPEVPVVFMTGRENQHLNDTSLGPRQLLIPKPFSLTRLARTVVGLVEQRQHTKLAAVVPTTCQDAARGTFACQQGQRTTESVEPALALIASRPDALREAAKGGFHRA